MRSIILSSCIAAIGLVAGPAAAQSGPAPIEQRLSAEQLRATGLDRLTADELALLNRLLQEERVAAAQEQRQGLAAPKVEEAPVSARLPGEFRGWSNGTVFRLENGQSWRVIDGDLYLGKPRQDVMITISPGFLGAWYLQAEGEASRAKVKRVE